MKYRIVEKVTPYAKEFFPERLIFKIPFLNIGLWNHIGYTYHSNGQPRGCSKSEAEEIIQNCEKNLQIKKIPAVIHEYDPVKYLNKKYNAPNIVKFNK